VSGTTGGDTGAREPRSGGGDPPARRSLDDWLEPYFRDSTLWPVLVVAAAVLVTFAAALLLLAVADRKLSAMAALALAFGASVDAAWREWRAQRRLGLASRALLGVWALATVVAFAANRLGIF
jgi:hypothetical protein